MFQLSTVIKVFSVIGVSFVALVNAQAIDITGTVVDSATSEGIAGAIVRLVEAPALASRTTAAGSFILKNAPIGVINHFSAPKGPVAIGAITLNGNSMTITGIRPTARVSVDVYTCNGARINHIDQIAGANGVISSTNLWQAAGAYLIKTKFDGQEFTVFNVGKKKTSLFSEGSPATGLEKASASTYTLDVSAPGYSRQQMSLATMTGNVGAIQLTKVPSAVTVFLDSTLYAMDGFGACIAYDHPYPGSPESQEFLYGLTDKVSFGGSQRTPIGLSTFRIAMNPEGGIPDGTKNAIKNAYKVNPNIRYWGAPWSPSAKFKTSGRTNSGGLKTDSYDAWADVLANTFPKNMRDLGIPAVYAISAQNEPDIQVPYDMCAYSPTELANFCKVLGPKLHAANPPIRLVAIETATWEDNRFWSYYDAIKSDTAAFAAVDIISSHSYPSNPPGKTVPIHKGKGNWQTEVWGGGDYIGQAKLIHDNIVIGNCSAYHWWEFSYDGNALLSPGGGQPNKVSFVFGSYSRFVRPGFMRVHTDGTLPSNVVITAYRDSTNTPVVVAINQDNNQQTITIATFGGAAPKTVTPWVTSNSDDLIKKTPLTCKNGVFTATLQGRSITSFSSY